MCVGGWLNFKFSSRINRQLRMQWTIAARQINTKQLNLVCARRSRLQRGGAWEQHECASGQAMTSGRSAKQLFVNSRQKTTSKKRTDRARMTFSGCATEPGWRKERTNKGAVDRKSDHCNDRWTDTPPPPPLVVRCQPNEQTGSSNSIGKGRARLKPGLPTRHVIDPFTVRKNCFLSPSFSSWVVATTAVEWPPPVGRTICRPSGART